MLTANFHLRCTFIHSDKATSHLKYFQIFINELQKKQLQHKLEQLVAGSHYILISLQSIQIKIFLLENCKESKTNKSTD